MKPARIFPLIFALLALAGLAACAAPPEPRAACPVTEPEMLLPPDDDAVGNPPVEGWYYANSDGSILAAAWWYDGWLDPAEPYHLTASPDGVKTGWFRPAGAALSITGERFDGEAAPLEAEVPCCYPTRFQATGLIFPTEGCWAVHAEAEDKALSFTVWVDP